MEENWVCIGHSHVVALKAGAEKFGVALDAINFWETGEPWLREAEVIRLRSDLAERVSRGGRVLSVIGGSAHTLGVVEFPHPFDFVLPADPSLPVDETRVIVPAHAVLATLTKAANPYFEVLPALLAVAKGPVVQLGPPPPVADEARVARLMPWDFFPGQPRKIAPKWLRYKLWRMYCDLTRKTCATLGIGYIPSPPAAEDSEGFLHDEYVRDGSHGNAAYGALVLDALMRAA